MTGPAQLEDKLVRIGHAQAKNPPGEQRKRGIMARLFGDPASPHRIGRFIDLGLLGHGAMGTVRRAYDERLAREVAIKLMRRQSSVGHNHDRLQREAQALAQLSHPNVVQIYEVGEVDGEVFIAMELVDGVSLDAWQRDSHPWRERLDVYLQAGRGLAAAHAKGLVHRDFKPANCIRDPAGRVRVLDFGLARAVDLPAGSGECPPAPAASMASIAITAPEADAAGEPRSASNSMLKMHITDNNTVVGTIAYMAPEQFVGGRVDAKSDQFAYCVALHEALYGRPPFDKDPRPALRTMAGGEDVIPVFSSNSGSVPNVLQRALRRGLAADPNARWPTMDALLRELERPLSRTKWHQLWLLAMAVGGTASVTAAVHEYGADDGDPCVIEQDQLEPGWSDARRGKVREALRATGVLHADDTWVTVDRALRDYIEDWDDASLDTCRASRAPNPPAQLFEQRRCLRRGRASFDHGVELLLGADAKTAEHAVRLVTKLPLVDDCRRLGPRAVDIATASGHDQGEVEAIARALARARTLEAVAQYPEGLSAAADAVAGAEPLGDGPLLAEALHVQGHLLMSAGDHQAAESKLRAASTMALQHDSDEVAVLANATLGYVIGVERARTDEGLFFVGLAANMAERPEISIRSRVLALTDLGSVSIRREEFPKAQAHFERALEVLETEFGEYDFELIRPLDGLATALHGQGELALALKHRTRSLEIRQRLQGERHPAAVAMASTMAKMAAVFYEQRDYPQARRYLDKAIPVLVQTLGANHRELAAPHNSLAAVFAEQGDYERAESESREAIRIWEHTLAADHPQVAGARINLATILRNGTKTELAIEQYEAVLDILDDNEPTPPSVRLSAQARRDLGKIRLQRKDLEGAEAHYRQGLTTLKNHGLEGDAMMASLLNGLGHVVLAGGDAPQAERLHRQAMMIYQEVYGQEHLKVAYTLSHLADAVARQRRWEHAEEYVERALASFDAQDRLANSQIVANARRLRAQIEANR